MVKSEKQSVKTEIKKAFMQLLLQKPYMDITVSDLVNKAQVARMSFYRNFNSIDDVIESIANDTIQNFTTDIIPALKENNERKWRELLFEMIYRFLQINKLTDIHNQEYMRNQRNYKIIMDRAYQKVITTTNYDTLPKETTEKYINIGKMCLISGVIEQWFFTGMTETPEEIVDIVLPMIMKL